MAQCTTNHQKVLGWSFVENPFLKEWHLIDTVVNLAQIYFSFLVPYFALAAINQFDNFISLLSFSISFINPTLRQSFLSYIIIHFPHKIRFLIVPILFNSSCRSQPWHNICPSVLFTHLETCLHICWLFRSCCVVLHLLIVISYFWHHCNLHLLIISYYFCDRVLHLLIYNFRRRCFRCSFGHHYCLVTQQTPHEIIAKSNSQIFDDLGIMNLIKEARFMEMRQ